jgi:hypothetical protein
MGCLVVVGLYFTSAGRAQGGSGRTVVIQSLGTAPLTFDLTEERLVQIDGVVGKTVISISRGGVHFVSSCCPHHLCIKKGTASRAGEWIACLPNGVVARISGEAAYDGITP